LVINRCLDPMSKIHITDPLTKGNHVTVCILAYFLINDMEVRLKARNVGVSPQSAFKEFKKCQVSRIEIKGSNKSKLQITEPTLQQIQLLQALDCETVINSKYVKRVFRKAQNWV